MGTLLNKSNEILNEKTNKIIPENIKSGVEIFDITGNYTGQGGNLEIMLSTGIKFGYSVFNELPYTINTNDIRNVVDMEGMFSGCYMLTNLNVSNWNTSNVTQMGSMFYRCENLTNLDVSNWNISKVSGIYGMFSQCSNLTNLDVSNWDTSKVTSMSGMFSYCQNIINLDVSNWNIGNVYGMTGMYNGCENLSNNSLNSILNMLSTVGDRYTNPLTLSTIGLSEPQANICVNLDNWSKAQNRGWTTGY